jgi:hypothetical protein
MNGNGQGTAAKCTAKKLDTSVDIHRFDDECPSDWLQTRRIGYRRDGLVTDPAALVKAPAGLVTAQIGYRRAVFVTDAPDWLQTCRIGYRRAGLVTDTLAKSPEARLTQSTHADRQNLQPLDDQSHTVGGQHDQVETLCTL